MKTSIATVSISGTFRDKLEAIASAGFDGIEIFEQDFLASDYSPAEIGRMVRDHGLEITLFQPFRDFEALPEPHRARAFARARRKFDLMSEMGVDLMLICSSVHPASLGGIDRIANDLRELGEIAHAQGLRIGYEALAWGRHVNDHRDAWEAVRRADHPNVGLILDSFHSLGRKLDPASIRMIPGDKIFFLQLADAPAIEMDLLYWSRHFRNMPGEGDLAISDFLRAVWATGYDGPLSLEIFNDQFRAGPPRLTAIDGLRSLLALADQARREEPAIAPAALPMLPPPALVEGVEFVEFATDETEAIALEGFLQSAGFVLSGQHLSKKVKLYRQGSANVLVNTDPAGHGYRAFSQHGTNVSEIALMVPDAKAAQNRALALRAKPHHEHRGEDELDIPAITGMGGSVIRFLDRQSGLAKLWEVDFNATPAETSGLITGFDHIAQTMDYAQMLSWSLFYTSLFSAKKSPMIDVIDPHGLVRSQAVQSGGLRVTLNGAEARRTLAGQFIDETSGANVQHIALASSDIFATAQDWLNRGFPILTIGENYYEDLAARFGLGAESVARLKALNLLYDEDEAGGFYHFYSQRQQGGFFLEVVQRIDGYQTYGGPNAPFRIAALKRAEQSAK